MATEEDSQKREVRMKLLTKSEEAPTSHGRGVKPAPGMSVRPTVGVAEAVQSNLWELEVSKRKIARLESGNRVWTNFTYLREKVGLPVTDKKCMSLEDAKNLAVHLCLVRKIKPKTAETLVHDALRYQSEVLGQTTIASDPEKMKSLVAIFWNMSYYHIRTTTKQAIPILKKDVDHAIQQCITVDKKMDAAAIATLWATAGRFDSMQWVAGEDLEFLTEECDQKHVFSGFNLKYNKMKQGSTEGLTYHLQDRDVDNPLSFSRCLVDLLIEKDWLVFVSDDSPNRVNINITEDHETTTEPSGPEDTSSVTADSNTGKQRPRVTITPQSFSTEEEREERKRSAPEGTPEPAEKRQKIIRTVKSFEEFKRGIALGLVPEIVEFAHKQWLFTWDNGTFQGNLLSKFSIAKGKARSTVVSENMMYNHYRGKRRTIKQMNDFLNEMFHVFGFKEHVFTTRSFRRGKITSIAIQRFFRNGGGWKEGDIEYISDAMGWRDKEHIKRYMDNVVRQLRSFTDLDSDISDDEMLARMKQRFLSITNDHLLRAYTKNSSLNVMDHILQSIISAFDEEEQLVEPSEKEEETAELKEVKRLFAEQEQLMKKYGQEYEEDIAIGKEQSSLYQTILSAAETGREPDLMEYSLQEVESFIAELTSKFRAKKLEPIMIRILAKWSVERKVHKQSRERQSVSSLKEWEEKASTMVHTNYANKSIKDIDPNFRKFFSKAMDPQFRDVMAKHVLTAVPKERQNDRKHIDSCIISYLFGKYHTVAKDISFLQRWHKIFRNTGINPVVKGFCVQYAQHHFKSEFNPNFQVGDVVIRNPHKNKRATDEGYTPLHREAQEKMYDLFKGPIPRLTASGEKMEKLRAIHTELEIPLTEIEKSRTKYKSVLQRSEEKKISFAEALAEVFDYHNNRRAGSAASAALDAFFPPDNPPTLSTYNKAITSLTPVERKHIEKRNLGFNGYLKQWKKKHPSPAPQKNLMQFFKSNDDDKAPAEALDMEEVIPYMDETLSEALDIDEEIPEAPANPIQLAVMTDEDMELFNAAPQESLFTSNSANYFGEDTCAPKESADATTENIGNILRAAQTLPLNLELAAQEGAHIAQYCTKLMADPEGVMSTTWKSLLAESRAKFRALLQNISADATHV
ncbi:hypothetical protein PROFUN_14437 [Planoprotostelium fungivorum]|uniref:Uncharacterized protein n=1 Tax=Planoprotostelium fungivorum TaxID=1890364 RepID=A0A2P6N0C4_9EUKA|nr:hypothetical protein PROFUN_14437 [Planoprotostelium fungivorum]